MSSNDERFVMPLYSAAEAARHLDVPASTFRTWAHGYRNSPRGRPPVVGDPIVTTVPIDVDQERSFGDRLDVLRAHTEAA
jgi:transposase-like protein